jgi:hypothetical protein
MQGFGLSTAVAIAAKIGAGGKSPGLKAGFYSRLYPGV